MAITFQNITDPNDFLILTSTIPYEDVSSITGFSEDYTSMEGTVTKEFRWSYDGVTYSQWLDLSLSMLQSAIDLTKYDKFWMEYKYTLEDTGDVGIASVQLTVIYETEPLVNEPLPIAYSKEKGNRHWPIRLRAFSLKPYAQENTIKLQKDLSFLVNQIHGHEITYLRAVPVPESRDVIFMEWTLHNVTDPKCIKVLVPDNVFPEHKLNHNAFGLDFEMPFEIHIDKRYFEWEFGHNTRPQKRDIIYFPLTNRLYEVDSASISVQFMYDFLYWQINIVKYQPKRNVIMDTEVAEMVDNYSTGIEDLFGKDIDNEIKDITNPQQLVDKSTKFDKIRKYVSPWDMSVYEAIENNYTTVSQYYYNLNKHFLNNDSVYNKAVSYKIDGEFTADQNLAYTCWFREISPTVVTKDIDTITVVNNIISVKFKYGLPKVAVGNILSLSDTLQGDFGLFGTITAIDTNRINLVVTMEVDTDMLTAANALHPTWKTSTTLKGGATFRRNFLHTYNETTDKGIVIDTYDSRYIRLQLNESVVWFPLPVILQAGVWYGFVVNILNTFNQISYHIYKMKPAASKTTILENIVSQVISGLTNIDRSSGTEYQILGSPLNITNVRILDESLELEQHSPFLNSEIIKDASHALIIDNAIPKMKLPYIGNTK